MMKWYDYVMCLWFADLASAGVMSGSYIALIFAGILYALYEQMRRDVNRGDY